jgi:hypothetical protein
MKTFFVVIFFLMSTIQLFSQEGKKMEAYKVSKFNNAPGAYELYTPESYSYKIELSKDKITYMWKAYTFNKIKTQQRSVEKVVFITTNELMNDGRFVVCYNDYGDVIRVVLENFKTNISYQMEFREPKRKLEYNF